MRLPGFLILILTVCSASGLPGAEEGGGKPYGDFGSKGAGFYGPGRDETAPLPKEGIRIGLTCPSKTPEGEDLRIGAEMAIEEANSGGGCQGKPFVPVFRPDDGPWGMAAKQIAALAFDDEVWAILGGIDGTRAHLAELVSAKAWVPVVTPAASDFTIDYANVPWMFRFMPSDDAQARALTSQALARGLRSAAVLVEGERDAVAAGKRIREAAGKQGLRIAIFLQFDPVRPEVQAERLKDCGAEALIIWGREETCLRLLKAVRGLGLAQPAFGPSILGTPRALAAASILGDLTVAAPYDLSSPGPAFEEFARRFKARAAREPGPIAVCAYDTARLILGAIERAGLSRARIRDEISATRFSGLCGQVAFNGLGGNTRPPVLARLEGGRWVKAISEAATPIPPEAVHAQGLAPCRSKD